VSSARCLRLLAACVRLARPRASRLALCALLRRASQLSRFIAVRSPPAPPAPFALLKALRALRPAAGPAVGPVVLAGLASCACAAVLCLCELCVWAQRLRIAA
jgi:hypothetical protein